MTVKALFSLALSVSTLASFAPASAQERPVAFVNVNVVPMDRDRVLTDQTVIVENGKITAVGPAARTTVPANALRVDGRGKYLTPGIAEMHGHVPAANPNAVLTPENVLFLYIAGGATTVRGMQGHPSQLQLRQRVERGEIIGPRLYLSAPPLSGGNTADVATAEQKVRDAKQAGYDHLKVHEDLTKPVYDAIVKTAREVGLEWGGHVSVHVGVRGAIAAKQSTIDHLDDYIEGLEGDESKIPELVKLTKDAGIANVPTMPLWEVILGLHDPASMNNRPELRYMPPQTRQAWADRVRTTFASADKTAVQKQITLRNRMLKALSDAGTMILLGSDAPQLYSVPGFSLQREMETMVAAGMTPYQVLASGTINVARFHKNESETGTVAVGRRADLLLVDGNPLQDIRNMGRKSGVMVKGRWLPWSEIQQRLDQIAASYE
jgi:imidazolonepropionase-like amidohydrolase